MRKSSNQRKIPRRRVLSFVGGAASLSLTFQTATATGASTNGSIASLPDEDWAIIERTDLFSNSDHRTGTERIYRDQSQADNQLFLFGWSHSYFAETVITRESPSSSGDEGQNDQQNSGDDKSSSAGADGFHSSAEDEIQSRFKDAFNEHSEGEIVADDSGQFIAYNARSWREIGEQHWELRDLESPFLSDYSTHHWIATPDDEREEPDSLTGGLVVSIPRGETTHYGLGIIYRLNLQIVSTTGSRSTTALVSLLEDSISTS